MAAESGKICRCRDNQGRHNCQFINSQNYDEESKCPCENKCSCENKCRSITNWWYNFNCDIDSDLDEHCSNPPDPRFEGDFEGYCLECAKLYLSNKIPVMVNYSGTEYPYDDPGIPLDVIKIYKKLKREKDPDFMLSKTWKPDIRIEVCTDECLLLAFAMTPKFVWDMIRLKSYNPFYLNGCSSFCEPDCKEECSTMCCIEVNRDEIFYDDSSKRHFRDEAKKRKYPNGYSINELEQKSKHEISSEIREWLRDRDVSKEVLLKIAYLLKTRS